MPHRTFLAACFGLGFAAYASASELTVSKVYPAQDVTAIDIEFPVGSLVVSDAEGDAVEVTMAARCREGDRCYERARKVKLLSDRRGGTLVFKLDGLSKFCHKPGVELRIKVPRSRDVAIEMGVGDLDIMGVDGNVRVHMGVGGVKIRVPEAAMNSVDLRVGVGDADLQSNGGHREGSGFISKRLAWREGPGHGKVVVDLGVGDVGVALN